MLEIKDLHVSVEGREVLKGVNLKINRGEIHVLMGPNGSGKSTLALTLIGHPKYKIEKGEILFDGQKMNEMAPDKRAKLGLFLGFQNPTEIPGVTLSSFLWSVHKSRQAQPASLIDFNEELEKQLKLLGVGQEFAERYVNDGLSGGEKKTAEILQLTMLRPKLAILDEIDSGLDIDSLKTIGGHLSSLDKQKMGVLLITHYKRILAYVKPDFIHVLIDGRLVESGKSELAEKLEEKGYDWLKKATGE